MNHRHLTSLAAAAAALSALLSAAPAAAQSTVTLYGRINTTVESQKTSAGRVTALQNNSSRWGVRGTEDLGGGLKAGFKLESGVSSDTGQGNATGGGITFTRGAEVNLSGGFGMLRLGRMFSEAYFATADYISNHNHDTGTSSDALYAYLARDTNKFSYRLPEFVKGTTVEIGTSLKEGVAGANNTTDVAINSELGAVQLGFGYQKDGRANQYALRAFVPMGALGLGAYVQRDKNAWGVAGSRTNVRFSGMYTAGQNEFHVNLGSAGKIGSTANSKAKQYTLGYNYNLSKRTKLYGFYTKLDDGAARVYGGDFSSLAAGIRHNF